VAGVKEEKKQLHTPPPQCRYAAHWLVLSYRGCSAVATHPRLPSGSRYAAQTTPARPLLMP
jgi:hypothetical protein